MRIYLMQHGQAFEKEQNPERPLTPEGEGAIRAAAKGMARLGISFDTIVASTRLRSRQTAELVAEALELSPDIIRISETVEPKSAARPAVEFITGLHHHESVLVAGHLPSLNKIAAYLLAEDDWPMVHFEYGGLCRIDTQEPPTRTGLLYCLLTQQQLALIGSTQV